MFGFGHLFIHQLQRIACFWINRIRTIGDRLRNHIFSRFWVFVRLALDHALGKQAFEWLVAVN